MPPSRASPFRASRAACTSGPSSSSRSEVPASASPARSETLARPLNRQRQSPPREPRNGHALERIVQRCPCDRRQALALTKRPQLPLDGLHRGLVRLEQELLEFGLYLG